MKSKNKTTSEQLILAEKNGDKPPLDKKKLVALEKERIKSEKKLKKGENRKNFSDVSTTLEYPNNSIYFYVHCQSYNYF